MALSFPQLRQLARQVFKVVTGGPVDKTRGAGVIAYLDKLTEKMEEVAGSAGGATFPANEPPTATAFGNLPAGSVLASRSVLAVLRQAGSATETFPGYAVPYATLLSTVTGDVERGTTITPTLTPGFVAGDAGTLNAYELTRGNTVLAADATAPITAAPFDDSYQIGEETVTYTALFGYAQGAQKTGSQGSPAPGRIPAGEQLATATVSGRPRLFYGPAAVASTSSALARALPASRLTSEGGTFLLHTGTAATLFEVVAPDTLTVSVIDLDALNAPMPYTATALPVNDAGGTAPNYKVWRLTIADPYSSTHRHQVTLS